MISFKTVMDELIAPTSPSSYRDYYENVLKKVKQALELMKDDEGYQWDHRRDSVLASTLGGSLLFFKYFLEGHSRIDGGMREYLSHRSGMDTVNRIIRANFENPELVVRNWTDFMTK